MESTERTAILIVGMHRSGTSALAGVLGKLGIPLGDRLLEPADDNPKGYWEHQDVVAVHERLLAHLGSRWDDVRALPDGWLASEPARNAAAALEEIIEKELSGRFVWAVKDPRLCRLLPLWFEVLRKSAARPVVLFMVRRPSEVSASIEARNHWRPVVGKLLWLRYMTEAAAASSGAARGVVLYDELLADPISAVTKALASLEAGVGQGISTKERDAVSKFVDVADRHHTDTGSGEAPTAFDLIAEELYEALAAAAHGSSGWLAVEKAMEAFDREWRRNGACIDAMADMAARIESNAQAAKVESYQIKSALNAQVRWSEEAQARYEALQAQHTDVSSNLIAQVRWSEEAQARYETLQAQYAELASRLTAKVEEHERAKSAREAIATQLEQVRTDLLATETALRGVYGSMSWRSTKPLRAVARLLGYGARPANGSMRKPE